MRTLLLTMTSLMLEVSLVLATVPSQMTVQGKLTDIGGNPPPAGAKTFTFRVFNAENGGAELWPGGAGESQTIPTDAAGLWSAKLGSQIALTDAVFNDASAWLQITVNDGQTITTLPRTRLVAAPYAMRVATLDGATGGSITFGGFDMPFNGSSLNNNQSGFRWYQPGNMPSAFGLVIWYGQYFQGSYDGINSAFGVRAPTPDGSPGPVVFSVGPTGNVWTNSTITSQSQISALSLSTSQGIVAGGNISAASFNSQYDVSFNGGLIVDDYISTSGNVCAANVTCPSDNRLKDKIETLSKPLDSIQRLRGVRYEWRREEYPDRKLAEGEQIGLIAQEVQQVVPQAVQEMPDGYLAVDYARLVPLLIEGMKEQQQIIERQNERIANLEKKLEQ